MENPNGNTPEKKATRPGAGPLLRSGPFAHRRGMAPPTPRPRRSARRHPVASPVASPVEIPATDPQGSLTEQLNAARIRADGLHDNLERERKNRRDADAYHADALTRASRCLTKAERALSPTPDSLFCLFRDAEQALNALGKAVACAGVDDAMFPSHLAPSVADALRIVRSATDRARAAKVFAVDVG